MKRFKRPFAQLRRELITMAKRYQIIEYDVMLGLISSLMLGLFEILSYFFISPDSILFREIYLINGGIMGIQFISFFLIFRNGYRCKNPLQNVSLALHPYLIVLIGMAITCFSFGLSDRLLSFVIAVFTASFVQIYPPKRRVLLFGFSLTVFLSVMALLLLPQNEKAFLETLRNAVMIVIVGLFYTSIQYQSTTSRIQVWNELEEELRQKTEHMALLEKTNSELASSHRITDAMLQITTEILNTDHLDEVLQMVLDEAIRLIPAAQAGSILIKEGDQMQFRAACGYDLARLQTIPLRFEDLFQSKQKDLYEPTIIRNLEAFDFSHLNADQYDGLKQQQALIAKSVLTCSFRLGGSFFGSINLDNFDSEEAFQNADLAMVRHLAVQLEITIRIHQLYEKAIRPTKYDDLTQACTRKYYREIVEKTLHDSSVTNQTASLVVVDINHFKQINDRLGHDAGDDCLAFFASAVRKCVLPSTLFGRIGGDEFSLLFPSTGMIESEKQLLLLKEHLERHGFYARGSTQIISFAFGIAVFPQDGSEFDALFRVADQRMYRNKVQSDPASGL
jgi:diguanylate cyclase (GGDEF)-like protein